MAPRPVRRRGLALTAAALVVTAGLAAAVWFGGASGEAKRAPDGSARGQFAASRALSRPGAARRERATSCQVIPARSPRAGLRPLLVVAGASFTAGVGAPEPSDGWAVRLAEILRLAGGHAGRARGRVHQAGCRASRPAVPAPRSPGSRRASPGPRHHPGRTRRPAGSGRGGSGARRRPGERASGARSRRPGSPSSRCSRRPPRRPARGPRRPPRTQPSCQPSGRAIRARSSSTRCAATGSSRGLRTGCIRRRAVIS